MLTICVLADIHGNGTALRAVLDDLKTQQVQVHQYLILGDIVFGAGEPHRVLDEIDKLGSEVCIRGNTDRNIFEGEVLPDLESVRETPELFATALDIRGNYCWTRGVLAAVGGLEWVQALPVEYRTVFPDGTRVLAVHATPGRDSGTGIHAFSEQAELESLVSGESEVDLMLVGHTHSVVDRAVGDLRIVNPGAVSWGVNSPASASYALIYCEADNHKIEFRDVKYDPNQTIQAAHDLGHPGLDRIAKLTMEGAHPRWLRSQSKNIIKKTIAPFSLRASTKGNGVAYTSISSDTGEP